METKKCSKCKTEFPLTLDHFSARKGTKDGLHQQCRECLTAHKKQYAETHKVQKSISDKAYAEANKEKIVAYKREHYQSNKNHYSETQKAYRAENAEKIQERQSQYYEQHKDKISLYHKKRYATHQEFYKAYRLDNKESLLIKAKEYYKLNRESIRHSRLEYEKEYREANFETLSEKQKQYREAHKEKLLIRYSNYSKEHRDIRNANHHQRKAAIRLLPSTFTVEQWKSCQEHFDNCCAYCGKTDKLQQDHAVPLTKGGGYVKSNIIPACGNCNLSKGNRPLAKWYRKQTFYSKYRERVIVDYLNQDNVGKQIAFEISATTA